LRCSAFIFRLVRNATSSLSRFDGIGHCPQWLISSENSPAGSAQPTAFKPLEVQLEVLGATVPTQSRSTISRSAQFTKLVEFRIQGRNWLGTFGRNLPLSGDSHWIVRKRSILAGLIKILAVGCGLHECSLERTVSMMSPKSSFAPEHSLIRIDYLTNQADE
jgi:hypothetical protein